MGEIRQFEKADIATVASLFQRLLRNSRRPATPALEAYLSSLFLNGPDHDPDINSQVHVGKSGAVSGFIGALPLPMLIEGRQVRGAIAVALMADRADDPFAGARLMRAFLAGPQDISLTETANHISTAMLRKLDAVILPSYSLEWLRIIRPVGLTVELAAHAARPARLLAPLARPVDALMQRSTAEPRWFNVGHKLPARALASEAIDDDAAAALIGQLTEDFTTRPLWSAAGLRYRVVESGQKSLYGTMVRQMVTARDGHRAGMFVYHGDPGRIGRVMQILAAPGQAGAVIDSLLVHAGERGMVALRGRTMPALLEAMLGRGFMFLHNCSTAVHAQDPALVEPFVSGKAFFNGYAGESWSRLIGDRFD
jgi:hypothetical protein